MVSRTLGGLRLVLVLPLYLCLVVIDDKAHWTALGLYLFSVLASAIETLRAPAPTALTRIADSLLLLVMTIGLVVGGVTTIGGAAAGAAMIARLMVQAELARPAGVGRKRAVDHLLAGLTVLAFSLLVAPMLPGAPVTFDTHQLGGYILMGCGVLTLVLLGLDLARSQRLSAAARE